MVVVGARQQQHSKAPRRTARRRLAVRRPKGSLKWVGAFLGAPPPPDPPPSLPAPSLVIVSPPSKADFLPARLLPGALLGPLLGSAAGRLGKRPSWEWRQRRRGSPPPSPRRLRGPRCCCRRRARGGGGGGKSGWAMGPTKATWLGSGRCSCEEFQIICVLPRASRLPRCHVASRLRPSSAPPPLRRHTSERSWPSRRRSTGERSGLPSPFSRGRQGRSE